MDFYKFDPDRIINIQENMVLGLKGVSRLNVIHRKPFIPLSDVNWARNANFSGQNR
jgi:hypothetical protein